MAKKSTKPTKPVAKLPTMPAIVPHMFDPEQLQPRLYRQMSELLKQLEEKDSRSKVTLRERIAALIAVGRLQQIFAALRKAMPDDERTGSTVKKYAAAFTPADAAHKRAASAGRGRPEPEDWFEHADIESDDDDDGAGDEAS